MPRTSRPASSTRAGVIRDVGPASDIAAHASPFSSQIGAATQRRPVGVLLVVDRVAAGARGLELERKMLAAGERARGVLDEPALGQRRVDRAVGHRRQHRLADARRVQRRARAELGRHPHQLAALDLFDEHRLAVVDDGEIGRLARLLHQPLRGADTPATTRLR